ncbi:MAG: hypothetical protein QXI81_00095 [Nitrososphaerota archaeon]
MLCLALFITPSWFLLVQAEPQTEVVQFPLSAPLDVNVVLVGIQPSDFGVETTAELTNILKGLVRKEAASYAGIFLDEPLLVAKFDVRLSVITAPIRMTSEFVDDYLRYFTTPAGYIPDELKLSLQRYKQYVASVFGTDFVYNLYEGLTRMDYVLQQLAYYTERYMPDISDEYNIYFMCGNTFTGGYIPVYYLYGRTPEQHNLVGMVGMNMYGGMWTGRQAVIDICAIPNPYGNYVGLKNPPYDYPPVWAYRDATQQRKLLANYVDEVIDTLFVKSLLYIPTYRVNTLIDVIVVDATDWGIGSEVVRGYLSVELMEAALKKLAPYNFYTFRYFYYWMKRDAPQLRTALFDWGEYITINSEKAFTVAENLNLIEEAPEGVVHIPALVFVGEKSMYVDEKYVIGKAIPLEEDPGKPRGVAVGLSFETVREEGLTFTVTHEVGHTLGLAHPHDDIDETQIRIVGPGKVKMEVRTRWIYSWTDTVMAYANVFPVMEDRSLFVGMYPMKTYFSKFDLDALDRAIVAIILSYYAQTRADVIDRLERAGIDPSDVKEIQSILERADAMASKAVNEFKKHNYFDRFSFTGLGAQLVSAFDYAWEAFYYINVISDFVDGFITSREIDAQLIAQLEQQISKLEDDAERLQGELENAQRLNSVLESRLKDAESSLAKAQSELKSTKEALVAAQNELNSTKEELDAAKRSLEPLQMQVMALAGVAAVLAIVAAIMYLRYRPKKPEPVRRYYGAPT